MSAPYAVRRAHVVDTVQLRPGVTVEAPARALQLTLDPGDPRPIARIEDQLDEDPIWRVLVELRDRADYVATLRLYRKRFYAASRLRQVLEHLDVMTALASAHADDAGVPIPAAPSPAPVPPSTNATPV